MTGSRSASALQAPWHFMGLSWLLLAVLSSLVQAGWPLCSHAPQSDQGFKLQQGGPDQHYFRIVQPPPGHRVYEDTENKALYRDGKFKEEWRNIPVFLDDGNGNARLASNKEIGRVLALQHYIEEVKEGEKIEGHPTHLSLTFKKGGDDKNVPVDHMVIAVPPLFKHFLNNDEYINPHLSPEYEKLGYKWMETAKKAYKDPQFNAERDFVQDPEMMFWAQLLDKNVKNLEGEEKTSKFKTVARTFAQAYEFSQGDKKAIEAWDWTTFPSLEFHKLLARLPKLHGISWRTSALDLGQLSELQQNKGGLVHLKRFYAGVQEEWVRDPHKKLGEILKEKKNIPEHVRTDLEERVQKGDGRQDMPEVFLPLLAMDPGLPPNRFDDRENKPIYIAVLGHDGSFFLAEGQGDGIEQIYSDNTSPFHYVGWTDLSDIELNVRRARHMNLHLFVQDGYLEHKKSDLKATKALIEKAVGIAKQAELQLPTTADFE